MGRINWNSCCNYNKKKKFKTDFILRDISQDKKICNRCLDVCEFLQKEKFNWNWSLMIWANLNLICNYHKIHCCWHRSFLSLNYTMGIALKFFHAFRAFFVIGYLPYTARYFNSSTTSCILATSLSICWRLWKWLSASRPSWLMVG